MISGVQQSQSPYQGVTSYGQVSGSQDPFAQIRQSLADLGQSMSTSSMVTLMQQPSNGSALSSLKDVFLNLVNTLNSLFQSFAGNAAGDGNISYNQNQAGMPWQAFNQPETPIPYDPNWQGEYIPDLNQPLPFTQAPISNQGSGQIVTDFSNPGMSTDLDTPTVSTGVPTDNKSTGSSKPRGSSAGKTTLTGKKFLWKPVSDKNGNAVVLLPPNLTGKIKSVAIVAPDSGKVLEKGKHSGVGNGDREHFRFSKPGAKYPDNAIVLVTLKDGSTQQISIRDTAKRLER